MKLTYLAKEVGSMSAETQGWNRFESQGSEIDEIRMAEAWSLYLGEKALNNIPEDAPKSDVWILQDSTDN
jgi:hypothetical protein